MPSVSTTTASYSTPLWLQVSSAVITRHVGPLLAQLGEARLGGRPVAGSSSSHRHPGGADAEQLDGVDAVGGGVGVEPVGDLGRHAVGGGHLGGVARSSRSAAARKPEAVRGRALGVVAHQGEPGGAALHGAELEQASGPGPRRRSRGRRWRARPRTGPGPRRAARRRSGSASQASMRSASSPRLVEHRPRAQPAHGLARW